MLVRLPYLSHGFISVEVTEDPVLSKYVQKPIKISFPFDRMSFRVPSLEKEPSLLEKPRFQVLYGGRREMMRQRMIILKRRRNRAGRHKTGCTSLRHTKKVHRTSYTLVERCLTRTSQISFESHLFTSYVNEDKLIPKPFLNFPMPLPLLSRLEN